METDLVIRTGVKAPLKHAPRLAPEIETSLSANALATISFDRETDATLYDQLCHQIRGLIDDRRLVAGVRLPSSRELAQDLGVSRNTVVNSYDQLTAEGLLESRVGAGTFVTEGHTTPSVARARGAQTSVRLENSVGKVQPLTPSRPDQTNFPRSAWVRAAARGQRKLGPDSLFASANSGYAPLRHYISYHLRAMRGLNCDASQIIITSGLTESLNLIATGLLNSPRGTVFVEDPGCQKTHQTLNRHGLRSIPVPVDAGGMRITDGLANHTQPDAIVVTPSRQYPLGCQLNLSRRHHLLDWSQQTKGWIIEDDYDCEYRFSDRPLPPLFTLGGLGRTIYLGSFSKVLFPQLRISFIVAPPKAVRPLMDCIREMGSLASLPTQAALSEFMASGQFATHLRSMRRLYKSRYHHIARQVGTELGRWLRPMPIDGGTQFCAHLKTEFASLIDDQAFAQNARENGVGILPLSASYSPSGVAKPGFIIGFANTEPSTADQAIEVLRQMFETLIPK